MICDVILYPQSVINAETDFLVKLMYDMIRGVFPLNLLDLNNQRHVQNAKINVVNHDLGIYPVNTKSFMSRGKPSCLKMEKQSASHEGGGCLNQTATIIRAPFS
jgi:hypothetical protein